MTATHPAEFFRTVDSRKIQVNGWIGERIKSTCKNNLLQLDWEFFADERSLSSAIKLADYLLQQVFCVPLGDIGESACAFGEGSINPDLAVIGLDLSLLALYRVTKDRRYLDFCVEKLKLADWNLSIVEGRQERVEGHVYCYLSHCLARIELESLSGKSVSREQHHGLAVGGLVRLFDGEYPRAAAALHIHCPLMPQNIHRCFQGGATDLQETAQGSFLRQGARPSPVTDGFADAVSRLDRQRISLRNLHLVVQIRFIFKPNGSWESDLSLCDYEGGQESLHRPAPRHIQAHPCLQPSLGNFGCAYFGRPPRGEENAWRLRINGARLFPPAVTA